MNLVPTKLNSRSMSSPSANWLCRSLVGAAATTKGSQWNTSIEGQRDYRELSDLLVSNNVERSSTPRSFQK